MLFLWAPGNTPGSARRSTWRFPCLCRPAVRCGQTNPLKTGGTKQKHHFLPETTCGPTAFHHASATEIVPNRTWCHAHPDVTERRKNLCDVHHLPRTGRSANRSLRSPRGCAGKTPLNDGPETADRILPDITLLWASRIHGGPFAEKASTPVRQTFGSQIGSAIFGHAKFPRCHPDRAGVYTGR